jgi:ribonuclease-3 family protein
MQTQLNDLLTQTSKELSCKPSEFSPLALAYIGDGVYEMFIRTLILSKGNRQVNKMHKEARAFVCASAQSAIYGYIEEHLTEEEHAVLKRGRNAKSATSPKHAEITDYRRATGVEALIGYLYLKKDVMRIEELLQLGVDKLTQVL